MKLWSLTYAVIASCSYARRSSYSILPFCSYLTLMQSFSSSSSQASHFFLFVWMDAIEFLASASYIPKLEEELHAQQ